MNEPLKPPVAASNARAIKAEEHHKRKKSWQETKAERCERLQQQVIKAQNAADIEMQKQLLSMSDSELQGFTDNLAAVKLGNEQLALPKVVREHKMSLEAYERHVRATSDVYWAKVNSGELTRRPKRIPKEHELARPFPYLKNQLIPLKPPCNN